MKRRVGIIIGIMAALFVMRVALPTLSGKMSIEEQIAKASDELNAKLPMTVDEETQLIHTSTEGRTFIYEYTLVNFTRDELDINHFKDFLDAQREQACADPNFKDFFKHDVSIKHTYKDKNDRFLDEIVIPPSFCAE